MPGQFRTVIDRMWPEIVPGADGHEEYRQYIRLKYRRYLRPVAPFGGKTGTLTIFLL
jgi:hypothetical protein